MDKLSLHPLTQKNLVEHNGASVSDGHKVPCARAEAARRQLHQLLWTLGRIGPRGQNILQELDVHITGPYSVHCRDSAHAEPDPNDVRYWEDKLKLYKDQYTPLILLEEAKGRVYAEMMVLRQLGREGARLLAHDELYIAGPYDVRCSAGRCSETAIGDVGYWEDKWRHFHSMVETLKSACPRAPSPAALTVDGSLTEAFTSDDEVTVGRAVAYHDSKVEAWMHTLQQDHGTPPRTTQQAHQSRANQPAVPEPPRPRKRKRQSAGQEEEEEGLEEEEDGGGVDFCELRRSKRLKAREIPSSSIKPLGQEIVAVANVTLPTSLGDHGLRRSARLALKPRKRYVG